MHVPVYQTSDPGAIGTDPSETGGGSGQLPDANPGGPHDTRSREGETLSGHYKIPIVQLQAAVPLTPIVEPQTNGWPRTTAETTLAGVVAEPPSAGKWIDVDIARQVLTAYDGSTPVKSVLVSTGTIYHPTIIGTFYV
jgi:hypothetical protein